ncbi:hypothetical protein [Maliponia aquimaris]|nr:hypothetical protein [Maliponia aquimaris]
MSFTAVVDNAQRMGVGRVEVNACGWSAAPHCWVAGLTNNAKALPAPCRQGKDPHLRHAMPETANPCHDGPATPAA